MKKTSYISKGLVAVSAVIFFTALVSSRGNQKNDGKITADSASYINQVKQFIAFITTTEIEENTLFLVEKPDMDKYCLQDIFENESRFTTTEKEFIRAQFNQPAIKNWSADLVKKAIIINTDTVNAIVKDNFKNGLIPIKDMKKAYSFSAPIF